MTDQLELTTDNVMMVLRDCVYRDDELGPQTEQVNLPADAVLVDGVINRFGFHPERIAGHSDEIMQMLMQLPPEFRQSEGGGWSFLNACQREDGVQWTGEHRMMETLLVLGIGAGKVKCQLPRDLWSSLPGGMPYYLILDGKKERVDAAE